MKLGPSPDNRPMLQYHICLVSYVLYRFVQFWIFLWKEVWWIFWCATSPSWVGSFCRQHQTGSCACAFSDSRQSWTDVSQDAALHQDLGLLEPSPDPHRPQAGQAQRPEAVCRPQLQRWVDLLGSYPSIPAESPPIKQMPFLYCKTHLESLLYDMPFKPHNRCIKGLSWIQLRICCWHEHVDLCIVWLPLIRH